ncbi:NAD(P)H-dependent flavin oxidoreductase [Fusibacter tunisiensis]|uniref:Probable nitronate monooxygenase n=1 Tax=Fusibacter tunisiensis TaxID=1008308 RepID=A0ABS2MNT8_9FIRM|nr:nitronate monooxygenase [Fusibacter tunisiensis]MBM7561057.1 NAD(P)H-dependent flavin oxidoreductase YrpB (nitropropane dioxygenase family) [Fusibacter tunisiensis]
MKLPELKIGDVTFKKPLFLGAMGVGVSRSSLASAVTNCGGLGVISGVNLGFLEPDFKTAPLEANLRALKKEIQKAKAITKDGLIGINFMVAMSHYAEHVKTAVAEGIDFIISGAGLPTELPGLVKNSYTKLVPIVSSVKAASLIIRFWDRNHQTTPDAIVIEGIEAGGHLGFKYKDLENNAFDAKETIQTIKTILLPYEEKYNKKIPVIFAGGIYDARDIKTVFSYGADGVQMATRFVASEECDAHLGFKKIYLNASKSDVKIIQSPVGLPGRALQTPLLSRLNAEARIKPQKCLGCLQTCDSATTPFCISDALIAAVNGDYENGLFFAGANVYKVDRITTVQEIFNDLWADFETTQVP